MKKVDLVELTKQELLAILVTNYQEIGTVFSLLPSATKSKDDKKRRGQILEDLKHLLKSYGVNSKDGSIYEIFKSDFSI